MFQVPTICQVHLIYSSSINILGMVLHSGKLPLVSKNKWPTQGKRTFLNSETKHTTSYL